jgi:mono/diheme cytochrome c family protein
MKQIVYCLMIAALLGACSHRTDAAVEQRAQGAPIYTARCATAQCHGTRGEGLRDGASFRVWPLVGPEFEARNPSAQVIFDVTRSGGERELRALTDQQIYDAIAYEMSLNGVQLDAPLTAQNAASIASGTSIEIPDAGTLFPPPGNASLSPLAAAGLPLLPVENGYLRLRVNQIANASAIGRETPSDGGAFVFLVFTLEDLTDRPLDVAPQFLRLYASNGAVLEPLDIRLDFAVARFYAQRIEPGHGTAAHAIFTLPASTTVKRLVYDDGTGHALSVELSP